jgi:hypothetical protein
VPFNWLDGPSRQNSSIARRLFCWIDGPDVDLDTTVEQ